VTAAFSVCRAAKVGKGLERGRIVVHCRLSLANYKVPRRVELSDNELPKSGTGKVVKSILRERFWLIRNAR